jgi:hypothetical protein
MPYNLRASQADRFNSPTGRFVSISAGALFFDFLANPAPQYLTPVYNASLMT